MVMGSRQALHTNGCREPFMTLYSVEKPVESSIPLRNEAEKTTSTSNATTLLLCLTLFVKRSYTAAELRRNHARRHA
jgi:hypothetical protein